MGNEPRKSRIEQSGAVQLQELAQNSESHHNDHPIPNQNPFWQNRGEVIVRQLPESLSSREGQTFFSQMQKMLTATQPRFVFDFGQVRELDAAGIHLLLQCLEEVMKLNGDVKLASVPPGPAATLEATGVDRLFEIFDRAADAAQSFHYLPLLECPMEATLEASHSPVDVATAGYAAD
jgi:anti-anti-sigma factor